MFSLEMNYNITASVVTDRHTHTQTDYCTTLPAHARRGLIMAHKFTGPVYLRTIRTRCT